MEKDFWKWHKKKQWIHQEKARPFFKEREIWFCYLGANIGFEEDGSGEEFLRPVVILKRFNEWTLFAIPLTRRKRSGEQYFTFMTRSGPGTALLAQGRFLDAKRLRYKTGVISMENFRTVSEKFLSLFKSLPPS